MNKARLLVLLLLLASKTSYATPSILSTWQNISSNAGSTSDETAACQMCHQGSGGGNGWNAYGWAIRQNLPGAFNAINSIASLDSDGDGQTNLTEIQNNEQPGWRNGANNTIFCDLSFSFNPCGDSNTQLANQLPPDFTTLIPTPISRGERIALETIASGFSAPNFGIHAPGINGFLFVVDQPGIVWKVELATGNKTQFLNVSSQIVTGGERGLLGLAFHPQFASNGLLYTYQSEAVNGNADFPPLPGGASINHQSLIVEWQATLPVANAQSVNLNTKRELLRIDQPQSNHNGGMIAFGVNFNGSSDNLLYISLGDGGGANDQGNGHSVGGNGQDTTNPLGSMLRIDPIVNNTATGALSSNGQYRIPSDNVFVSSGSADDIDEIYAYGLRNTFRFSFDSLFGDLYAADVGQDGIEEVSFVGSGQNLGWPVKEGSFWFDQNTGSASTTPPTNPPPTGFSDPFIEYDHDERGSVIGGFVYRGSDISGFNGRYVFGDLFNRIFYTENGNTIIREFDVQGGVDFLIYGFGQDADGEMYVMGDSGELKKLVPASNDLPVSDEFCFPVKAANNQVAVICL